MVKFTPALMLVVCLASASALQAQEVTKPLGKWERKLGKNRLTLSIEDNRLHISYAGNKPGTLHADYAMTQDGLIYGVITSIECDEDEEVDAIKTLFDAPFSFRFRIDEGALIIHDAKAHYAEMKDNLWDGRFKAVRPAAPRPAVVPTAYSQPSQFRAPSPSPNIAPSPCPIAPSFSSAKDGEVAQPNNTKDMENIFNFWLGFSR
jgi:hypothetical protein